MRIRFMQRLNMRKLIRYLLFVAAIIIVWQAWASVIAESIFHHKSRFLSKIPGCFVFVDLNSLEMYCSQHHIPLGPDIVKNSTSIWKGYSMPTDGILFMSDRWVEKESDIKYSLSSLLVDTAKRKAQIKRNAYLQDKLDNDVWQLNGDKLCQIIANYGHMELVQLDMQGRFYRRALPDLPKDIKVCKKWLAAASINGTRIVFKAPAEDIIFVDTSSQKVIRLVRGDSHWEDPDWDSPYSASMPYPVFSPDGNQVVISYGVIYVHLKLSVIDIPTKEVRDITVWRPSTPGDILSYFTFSNPMQILDMTWIPNSDYIACEVEPQWDPDSYIYVVKVTTGQSYRLPVKVSRFEWSWMPKK